MKFEKYKSRFQAGQILADYVLKNCVYFQKNFKTIYNSCFIFAIPNGGIPVAEGFCDKLNLKFDILIVRKIKIPFNTEAGFGSITTDGSILLNKPLLKSLSLTKSQIENSIELTKNEIKERLKFYNKNSDFHENYKKLIKKKYIFLIDDGLASGFTMLAAIHMIKKYSPIKILIAVPTAPYTTVLKIEKVSDGIFCPHIKNTMWFAVADAYINWYDIPEFEVHEILKKSIYYIENII